MCMKFIPAAELIVHLQYRAGATMHSPTHVQTLEFGATYTPSITVTPSRAQSLLTVGISRGGTAA